MHGLLLHINHVPALQPFNSDLCALDACYVLARQLNQLDPPDHRT
jgi:hypothetical protein